MTEVTPSCDFAHNERGKSGTYGLLVRRGRCSQATKFSGTFRFTGGKYLQESNLSANDKRLHVAISRARHKSLRSLYQTLRSNERHRGFNKTTEKLSRRNENET